MSSEDQCCSTKYNINPFLCPALDLFDLDEQFATDRTKLAQITNKCQEEDLEYFVRECGNIMGITGDVAGTRDAKHILEHIFTQLVEYKKVNQEEAA